MISKSRPESPELFGESYADLYDLVYSEKDYGAECEAIDDVVARFFGGSSGRLRVLDLGCGTGEHAIRLARLGYEVTGVDVAPRMLELARRKAGDAEVSIEFREGDIRQLEVTEPYEVALMMFAVLGYQTTNEDVLATLNSVRSALVEGGLLIFDVWYGPAVLKLRPERRSKLIDRDGQRVERESSATVDSFRQICDVDIRMSAVVADGSEELTHESHRMRFFFANEISLFLECTRFELIALGPFPRIDDDLTDDDWNLICVARAS